MILNSLEKAEGSRDAVLHGVERDTDTAGVIEKRGGLTEVLCRKNALGVSGPIDEAFDDN